MNNENKLIEKCKKFNYNFIWNKSNFWGTLVFILGFSPFCGLIDIFVSSEIIKLLVFLACIPTAIWGQLIYKSMRLDPQIKPFEKSNHFIGIYNIDDLH